MKIERHGDVFAYVFENDGLEVELLGYGASLRALRAPDRRGDPGPVALDLHAREKLSRRTG